MSTCKIYLLVDVDFDGYASSALMFKYLKHTFPQVQVTPLFHSSKIHGLDDEEIMNQILADKPCLVICPDSATSDIKQHQILKDSGIDVLVLDHHPVFPKSDIACVINNKFSPKLINIEGSGTLVAWKFCHYIDKQLNKRYAAKLGDIVYFSLISDIIDMRPLEHSLLSRYGCKNIQNKLLKQLCAKLTTEPLTNTKLSWEVIPKLSAIIRSDRQDIKEALFWGLVTEQQQYIDIVLNECEKIHSKQNREIKKYIEENVSNINSDNMIIFESSDDLSSEYRGLVASRYGTQFNRPVLLYKDVGDSFTGSLRSPIPIKEELQQTGLFNWVEGHDSAAGFEFNKDKLKDIQKFVAECPIDLSETVCRSYNATQLRNAPWTLVDDYDFVWGQKIPAPLMHIHSIKLNTKKDIELLGKYDTTIKFTYKNIDYYIEYRSKVWKKEHHITDNIDLEIEILGTLHLGKDGRKWVKIEKWEQKEIEPEILTWQDLF